MNRLATLAFAALLSCSLGTAARAADAPPWVVAQQVLDATNADFNSRGILGVEGHAADMEKALAGAKDAVLATRNGGTIIVLTDGTADVLLGLTAATVAAKKAGTSQNAVAVGNPYPMLSLLLGSYYDEVGRPDDAARVLDEGLALYEMDGYISPAGEHRSWLLLERTAASNSLKHFDETIALTDKGLAMPDQPDAIRAHFYRNRGFALTELGRFDESEAAYQESLKLAPGNQTALHELEYLSQLKRGGHKTEGGLAPLPGPSQTPPPPKSGDGT